MHIMTHDMILFFNDELFWPKSKASFRLTEELLKSMNPEGSTPRKILNPALIYWKFSIIFSWYYDLMCGATSMISGCLVLALLYSILHAITCLTRQVFRWSQAWHKAKSLLSYFLVYMSYVCLLSRLRREICVMVKENPILNLYFILALSIDKICFRAPSHFPTNWE